LNETFLWQEIKNGNNKFTSCKNVNGEFGSVKNIMVKILMAGECAWELDILFHISKVGKCQHALGWEMAKENL